MSEETIPVRRPAPPENLSSVIVRWKDRLIAWSERFVIGRFWVLKVFLLAVGFSVFCSGGVDMRLIKDGPDYSEKGGSGYGYTEGYYRKLEHPFMDVAKLNPTNAHEVSLNFRIAVPLFLHVLGLHSHWMFPIMVILGLCGAILLSCVVAYQLTGDRVCGLFMALNVASTYAGCFGLIGFYDGVAFAVLAFACLPNLNWLLRGLVVCLAGYTDDRAIFASTLLLAYSLCKAERTSGASPLINADAAGVVGGIILYFVTRAALVIWGGLSLHNGGNGPGYLISHLSLLHPGAWFALEGGWLLVAMAMIALWRNSQRIELVLFALSIAGMMAIAFMIGDLLRSTAYLFPAIFVGLAVLRRNDSPGMIRLYCLLAFAISAVGGNYNIYIGKITWFAPVPVAAVQALGRMIYTMIRPHVHNLP